MPRPLSRRLAALAPLAALVLLWFLFFWRVLVASGSDRLTFQQGDFTLQFLAYRQLAYRQLQEGRFPVFEECLYSGYPFQADPQSQVLYPPVLAALLLGRSLGWQTYPLEALEWEAALHVLWAALGTYLFLRRSLRLHRLASLFGALAFGFGGYLTGYPILQTGILETAAWLPWLLMALHWLSRAKRWLPAAVAAGAVIALSLTAGHPQTLLFMLYAGGFLFVIWARTTLKVQAMIVRGAIAGAFALGLSAAQLLPMLSFMLGSTRTAIPYEELSRGFALRDVALFVLTGVLNVYQPFYVGIPALVLAVLAIAGFSHKQPWVWALIALIALALSFGANAFAFDLGYWLLPGYRLFRQQERIALLVSFSAAVLSALGAHVLLSPAVGTLRDQIAQRGHSLLRWAGWVIVLSFALVLVRATSLPLGTEQPPSQLEDRLTLLSLSLLGTATLLLWRSSRHTPSRWVWGSVLLALLVFDIFTANRATVLQPYAAPFPPHPLIQPILDTRPEGATSRVYNHEGLPLNRACIDGLSEIGGGSPIVPAHYKAYLDQTPEHVLVQQLNVRYAVTWRGAMETPEGVMIPWFLLGRAGQGRDERSLYRLDWEPLEFSGAWIPPSVRAMPDSETMFSAMRKPSYQPFRDAFLFMHDLSYVQQAVGVSELRGQGSAALEGKTTGYMKIAATANAPALLVLSQAYHWNWVALVNGREVRPVPVNVGLLGVPIPAGTVSVELSYRPTDFWVGLGMTGLTALVALGAVLVAHAAPLRGKHRERPRAVED